MAEPSAYGGFWIRFVAYLVDSVILFTVFCLLALAALLSGFAGMVGEAFAGLMGLLCLAAPILYYGLMQASARQATVGKALLGMKVTGSNGERLSPLRSFARELAKIVSSIPMALGFLLAAFTGRKQALHDMMASTIVVRESRGQLLLGLVIGLFGWIAPIALVVFVGVGVFAAMMGVNAGMLQQAMQESQKQETQKKPAAPSTAAAAAQPKPAQAAPPAAPVETPVASGAVRLLRTHSYQTEEQLSARLGPDATVLPRYAKAIEQRFAAVGSALKGTPRTFGIAVIVKPDGATRSWLIPGPGEDREVAALYRTLEADVASIPAPQPTEGPVGFALLFSVHGGQPDSRVSTPMPPSWVQVTRSEQPPTFDAMVQAVWPDPRAVTAAKPAAQPVAAAAVPEPAAKPVDQPKPVETAKAEAAPIVPFPAGPTRPGPKYNDVMTAVLYSDTQALGDLLRLGRWADKPDSRGMTPITAAALLGDVKTAQVLLDAGVNPAPALAVARERQDGAMTTLLERYAR